MVLERVQVFLRILHRVVAGKILEWRQDGMDVCAVVEAPRSAFVEVTLDGGRRENLFVSHAPGTPENPLDTAGVNAKVRSLFEPVLGAERSETLIERVNALEDVEDIRDLRPLWSA